MIEVARAPPGAAGNWGPRKPWRATGLEPGNPSILPSPPAALLGGARGDDPELRADQIGRRLLEASGRPPDAMERMLAKVAARCCGDGFARRIAAARAAYSPSAPPAGN